MKKRNMPEVGENMSSGAEKVERIEREAEKNQEIAQREAIAAKERIEAAQARTAAKQARMEEKQRANARMAAKRAEERAKRKEEKAKRFEAEIAAIERERIARKQKRAQKRGGNGGGRQRASYGGWLAAVISLSVVSLLLTAAVTLGALNAYRTNQAQAAAYRGTMYELIGVVEKVDDDLDALRIANSRAMQSELLTDVLVQTRIAESDLEKLPISMNENENVMGFLNRLSHTAERMLEKLQHGEKLTEKDVKFIEHLYEVNHGTRETLDELAATMENKDVDCWMKGAKNRINDALQKIEDLTMPREIGQVIPKLPEMPGKPDMPEMPKLPDMKMEGNKPMQIPSAKLEDGETRPEELPSSKAEELCKKYFADYSIQSITYAGETMAKGLQTYNFDLTNDRGVRLFAQIAKTDGALVGFDYYEECHEHVVDVETAKNIAEDFLLTLGYENMVAVDVDEEDANVDFTFAYTMDGCVYYPDEIVVKVCEQRGVVCGFDASKFLKNHHTRDELNAKLTLAEAKEKLSDKLSVEACRLVLFEHKGKEVAAYEFFCSYQGGLYFIYTDALTGEELFIVNKNG